jgi:hypothetical protein
MHNIITKVYVQYVHVRELQWLVHISELEGGCPLPGTTPYPHMTKVRNSDTYIRYYSFEKEQEKTGRHRTT